MLKQLQIIKQGRGKRTLQPPLCLSVNESKSTCKASLADAMYTINQEAARVESKMAPGLSWSLAICIAPARLSWPDLTLLPPWCDLPGNIKLKA